MGLVGDWRLAVLVVVVVDGWWCGIINPTTILLPLQALKKILGH
jgi:hypothetical protein